MRKRLLFLIVVLLGMAGCLAAQNIHEGFIDGHLYFKFNDDYDFRIKVNENTTIDPENMPDEFDELFSRYGVTLITRPLYSFNDPQLERILRLEFTDAQNVDYFIKELELNENVEYAEKVPYYKKFVTYNDPLYMQTSLQGIQYNYKWHLEIINAPQAWELQQGSPNIKVAIVDNAVWGEHPDLNITSANMANFANGYAVTGNSNPPNSVNQNITCTEDQLYSEGGCPAYDWSHGTHCAGLAGAINNNGVGISSIGGGVTLMGVRVADNNGNLYYGSSGATWAANNGAKVISMSYGGTQTSNAERTAYQTMYNNGVILVAAAGNEGDAGNEINYPAGYSFVIGVASINNNGKLSSFSQYGNDRADIAAPGGFVMFQNQEYMPNILSTTFCKSQMLRLFGLNTANNQYYDGMQGTSMACPMVAGLCGLLASAYPSITPAQAKECLTSTGTALASGSNPVASGKYINAYAAVQCAQSYNSSLLVTPTSVTLPSAGGNQSVSVRAGQAASQWTATSSAAWLSINPSSGAGNAATTNVTLNATENTGSTRTATVTFTHGTETKTVQVTQSDASDLCSYLNEEIMADDSLGIRFICSNAYVSQGITKYAQKIEYSGNGSIDKIKLGEITTTGTTGSIKVSVMSATTAGLPNAELASKTINIATINASLETVNLGGGLSGHNGSYEITLDNPVIVSGNFFIAIDFTNAGTFNQSTFANAVDISATCDNDVMTNSLYLYYQVWRLQSTAFNPPLENVAAAILPHVCPTDEVAPNLAVNPTSLTYVAAGETKTVTVTSNINWNAVSSASWLTITPANGSNNGTITATAAANTGTSARTATITVSANGVSPQVINVTQAGATPTQGLTEFTYDFEACNAWAVDNFAPCTTIDGDGLPTYGIQNTVFENSGYVGSFICFENGIDVGFVAHGGTKFGACMAAALQSGTPVNNDWFVLPAINIQNGTTFSFWAKSATNQYGLERMKVAISNNNTTFNTYLAGSASNYVQVPTTWTQYTYDLSAYAGQIMYLAINCVSTDAFAFQIDDIVVSASSTPQNTLTVNPTSLTYAAAGETKTITVTSNTNWNAVSSASWLTITPANGSNNGTITATAAANTGTSARTATITVSANGVSPQVINVTQEASSAPQNTLTVNPTSLTYAAVGETKTITVTSNTNWNAVSSATWLTIAPASGNGNGTITAIAAANTGTSARTATITVSANGVSPQVINVTQEASSAPQNTLIVNPTSLDYIAVGETKTITVTSNTNWNAVSSATWLTIAPASGNGNGTIYAIASTNTGVARTATITVSANGVSPQVINVTQAAGTTAIISTNLDEIAVYPNPASDKLVVANAEGENILVINALGQVIATIENANSEQTIDVSNLANGTYYVKVGEQVVRINIVK